MEGRNILASYNKQIISTLILIMVGLSLYLAGLCTSRTNDCAYIQYPEGYSDTIIDINGKEYLSLQYYPEPGLEFKLAKNLQQAITYLMIMTGGVWGYQLYIKYGGNKK